jgi:hypothetical protein
MQLTAPLWALILQLSSCPPETPLPPVDCKLRDAAATVAGVILYARNEPSEKPAYTSQGTPGDGSDEEEEEEEE